MKGGYLMGKAAVHDLVLPQVRVMLAEEGIWIGRDTQFPQFTIPLSVQDGACFSLKLDEQLSPLRFLPSVAFHGPYLADPNEGAARTWISVDERVPTHMYSVLGYVVGGDLHFDADYCAVVGYNEKRRRWQMNDGPEDIDVPVSHWMDLPRAPPGSMNPRR